MCSWMSSYNIYIYIHLCNHHPNKDTKHFYHSNKFFHAPGKSITPSVLDEGNHWRAVSRLVLPFLEVHANGIVWYARLCFWLLSFSVMFLRSIYVVFIISLFLFIASMAFKTLEPSPSGTVSTGIQNGPAFDIP